MKNKLINRGVLYFLCMLLVFNLKAEKVTIIEQDWDKAQQLAKAENKLILIDFYTTWCVPCKVFYKNFKENEALQTELAKKYIMLKYDAEQDEMYHLTKKLSINSYPTFAVISPKVEFVGKLFGNALANKEKEAIFKDFMQDSWNNYNNGLIPNGFNTSLENGYPDFYVKFINRDKDYIKRGRKKIKEDINSYWSTTKDWSSEISFAVLKYFGGNDAVNQYVIKNKKTLTKKFGKNNLESILSRIVGDRFSQALEAKDKKQFEEARTFAKVHLSQSNYNAYLESYEIQFAKATNDCPVYEKLILSKLKKARGQNQKQLINAYSWDIYESTCSGTNVLNQAELSMAELLSQESNYAFLDTYACILFKNKKYAQAKEYMEKAIDLAKEEGQDAKSSRSVLVKINSALAK